MAPAGPLVGKVMDQLAEPARADFLGRWRHLLGKARQGDGRPRLLAARTRDRPPETLVAEGKIEK